MGRDAFLSLEACFGKIDETILKEIYESTKHRGSDSSGDENIGISCNCS